MDRMHWKHKHNYDLGIDVLVTVCSWNTNEILWLGHGCSGHGMLLEHEQKYVLSMGALVTHNMLLEHETNHYGLGMDVLLTVGPDARNSALARGTVKWPAVTPPAEMPRN